MKTLGKAVIVTLLATYFCFCGTASAVQQWVPIKPWTVSLVPKGDGHEAYCAASTEFVDRGGTFWLLTEPGTFEIKANGRGSFHEKINYIGPEWMHPPIAKSNPEHEVSGLRFWFDNDAMFPMRSMIWGTPPEAREDLQAAGDLVEWLARARYLKQETKVGAITEVNGTRVVSSWDAAFARLIEDGPALAQTLRSCLAALRRGATFNQGHPVTIPPTGPAPEVTTASIDERLRLSRVTLEKARFPGHSDEEVDTASFQLGHAAADALRLTEAQEALSRAVVVADRGKTLSPEAKSALERLVEVLLLAEQLDEAERVARKLPEPGRWLAAIAVSRGDNDAGGAQFLAEFDRILKTNLRSFYEFEFQSSSVVDARPVELDNIAEQLRDELLIWSTAALGQEMMGPGEKRGGGPFIKQVPSYALAESVFGWLDPKMIRDDGPVLSAHRRELGRAAFLRGESMRRTGFLQTAEIDLQYALFELDGVPGVEGLAARARVSLAALAADQGRELTALPKLDKALAMIEQTLGRESLPWLEGASLRSTLLRRTGDADAALKVAEDGLAVATRSLPSNHSLIMQLKRCRAEALLARGDGKGAARAALDAIGLTKLPTITDAQGEEFQRHYHALQVEWLEIFRRLEALPYRHHEEELQSHASQAPSAMTLTQRRAEEARWLEEAQSRLAEKERPLLAEEARNWRSQRDLWSDLVGLPVMPRGLPAVVRRERFEIARLLRQISESIAVSSERTALVAVSHAINSNETALTAELRAEGKSEHSDARADTVGGYVGDLRNLNDDTHMLTENALSYMVTKNAFYRHALDYLELPSIFPEKFRSSLRPGAELDGLDILFKYLKKNPLQDPKGPDSQSYWNTLLIQAQAASRDEVLATLMVRTVLAPSPAPDPAAAAARDVVQGEVWLRRQRGIVRDAIDHFSESTESGPKRAEIRRQFAGIIELELLLFDRFIREAMGGAQERMAHFLNWGSVGHYAVSVADFQSRLHPNEAVLVWLPLERTTQAFLIKPDRIRWVEINEGRTVLGQRIKRILDAIYEARDRLDRLEPGERLNLSELPVFPAADAYAMYRSLFSQLETDLEGVTHLYTAQLGITGGIPLGLLVTQPTEQGSQPAWLADRFAITWMPTLVNPAVFEKARHEAPVAAPLFLAIGDPIVGDPKKKCMPGTAATNVGLRGSEVRSISDISNLEPLCNARREMETVGDTLGLGRGDKLEKAILSGAQATRKAVIDHLRGSKHRVLMFATHGLLGGGVGEPALVLSAPQGGNSTDDGLLRASDVVGLTIDADLVILSACSTAPSGEDGAEPLAGLAAAFLVAGARSVIASHWTVRDDTAETLITSMVEGRKQNLDPAVAMQEAAKKMRDQAGPEGAKGHPHPIFWAPFEVIGLPSASTAPLRGKN